VLISSVEPKAMETAEIIAEKLELAVYVVEGLHEHERSNVPFLSKDDFQKTVKEFFSKPTELVFGDETAEQSYERFDQAVRSVLNYHHGKTIVLVAHGTVISLFVSRLTGIHDFSLWNELGLPSFVVIDPQTKTLIKKENIT
jgi:broad specificity phosphatase PhoE